MTTPPQKPPRDSVVEQIQLALSFLVVIFAIGMTTLLVSMSLDKMFALVDSGKMTVAEFRQTVPLIVGGGGVGYAVLAGAYLWFRHVRGK